MGTTTTTDPTLHLPRVLCLHGGGVTGEIFRLQARALVFHLSSSFRLVFADAPFFCDAGPGIIPVYAGMGPYRRWLRWLPHHQVVDADTAVEEIRYQIESAMEEDDRQGATGEWVGFMGFSQGAKVSASLLFESQRRRDLKSRGQLVRGYEGDNVETKLWSQDWSFAVLMAGRSPLVAFSPDSESFPFQTARDADSGQDRGPVQDEALLKLPTLHVHGLKDVGIHLHRQLLNQYCSKDSVELMEWDGDHRVPLKTSDVEVFVDKMLSVARKAGVEPGVGRKA
ncbi:putative citrinin biosynthesis oxidoreductase protein [Lasiodiplodia theobromae]|uniref:Putative esterase TOX9 n=1 Tax=Lasiodiplodia theobromae TaxID=45133 RepID=A0A5N5D9J5_9PEZI|nr:Citrinin biosynthesis oxidoreductase [Lasiodiplodia theobromae]KAB2574060.1 putative esterase TOX9 [Lasiodiplodia theobromae]KAF4536578.1 Citrinin biosynthesis oxidoreductase [Lasiodiplodia theobromae]KAF9633712.1 putative citrinin biosynthesis oxidoreductase protein [Lasiodiplodia theobromae]